jgi:hypothetical protein
VVTRIRSRVTGSFSCMYVRSCVGLGSSERISLNKPTTMCTYRRGLTGLQQVQWEGLGLANLAPVTSTISLAFYIFGLGRITCDMH